MPFIVGLFSGGGAGLDAYVELFLPNGLQKNVDNWLMTINGVNVYRQRLLVASPSQAEAMAEVGLDGALMVSSGGLTAPVRVNNASALTVIFKASAGRLCRIINTDATAPQTVLSTFYDDPAGNPNNQLWKGTLDGGQVVDLQIYCATGISAVFGGHIAVGQDTLVEII